MTALAGRISMLLAAAIAAAPAAAQSVCGKRAAMADFLKANYAERQDSLGVTIDGKLMEVFASANGTWTMLLSFPDGKACVVGHGRNWQALAAAPRHNDTSEQAQDE